MGALPGINIIILFYSIFSIIFLLSSSLFNIINWSLQLAIQIGAFALMAIVILIMGIAVKSAQYGSSSQVSKSDLLEQLRKIKRISSNQEIRESINDLLIFINSNMPHPAEIDEQLLIDAYQDLSQCDANNIEQFSEIVSKIKRL